MKATRRDFIGTGVVAGMVGLTRPSAADTGQVEPKITIPTERSKALMALFGLKYPIFEAPHGAATSPELAIAVSNAGAMGALANLGVPGIRPPCRFTSPSGEQGLLLRELHSCACAFGEQ